jgi:hypothetical protein
MLSPPQKGFWPKCRRAFRWCRYAIYAATVLILGCLLYLNQVGLPEFLQAKLASELRARGLTLKYVGLRLHWLSGIVAENVTLGGAAQSDGAQLSSPMTSGNWTTSGRGV